jgi:hypothetical protein
MAKTAKNSNGKDWLLFLLAMNPDLSRGGKARLKKAIATLQSDGVDIDSLCRGLIHLKNVPHEKPSTIVSSYSIADQRRIKALPKNIRAIAAMLKRKDFDFFLRWGAQRCPGLIDTLNYLSLNNDGLFLMRDGESHGDLFLKLPEILEDVAQSIENTMQHPPERMTFAMRMTWIVGRVEAESRSKRKHYQEILHILDPDGLSLYTYDGLKMLVARQRARQKKRFRQPRKTEK